MCRAKCVRAITTETLSLKLLQSLVTEKHGGIFFQMKGWLQGSFCFLLAFFFFNKKPTVVYGIC